MMDHQLRPLSPDDREAVMDIFNHYVEHSFAAYPEHALPYGAFDIFLKMADGYPAATVRDAQGRVIGFGLLRAYSPIPVFAHTAELSYFIHPDHTGRGLGKALLDVLERGAVEKGISVLLAGISSLNPGSLRFHRRCGFVACGCFRRVGTKNGQTFDVVWMQKMLGGAEGEG